MARSVKEVSPEESDGSCCCSQGVDCPCLETEVGEGGDGSIPVNVAKILWMTIRDLGGCDCRWPSEQTVKMEWQGETGLEEWVSAPSGESEESESDCTGSDNVPFGTDPTSTTCFSSDECFRWVLECACINDCPDPPSNCGDCESGPGSGSGNGEIGEQNCGCFKCLHLYGNVPGGPPILETLNNSVIGHIVECTCDPFYLKAVIPDFQEGCNIDTAGPSIEVEITE